MREHRKRPRSRLVLSLFAMTQAAVPSLASAADPALNLGAIDVVGLPNGPHVAAYPYFSGSLAIPKGRMTYIPGFGVEWSPVLGRWGLVGSFVADLRLHDHVGLDGLFTLIHDQAGLRISAADYYAGVGAGLSFSAGRWVISPSASVFRGINVAGWTFVPGLNVAVGLQ